MSEIKFSKMNDGYSQREVDTYISMIEYEHVKAVELITAQTTRIAELENVISRLTIENSQLTEKSKKIDLETAKTQEEIESLKKQLEEENKKFELETAKIQEENESLKKQLEEKNKKFDLETAKTQEEIESLKKQLEEEKSKKFDLETAKTQEEIESLKKQLEEKNKKFDLETAKAQEEIESLKKQLEEEKNKKLPSDNVFESKENLGESVLSFSQVNEELVEDTSSPKEQEMYHSKSQIDQIVDAILSEGNNTADTSNAPRFSL